MISGQWSETLAGALEQEGWRVLKRFGDPVRDEPGVKSVFNHRQIATLPFGRMQFTIGVEMVRWGIHDSGV